MKNVDPSVYTKEYYSNTCLGHKEFQNTWGKKVHPRNKYFLSLIKIKKDMKVLDIGCGRGDLAFYCASLGMKVIGIDYAKAGVALANKAKRLQKSSVKKNTFFRLMDAKKINFPENYFDIVISIDVFEHVYKEELDIIMQKILRVLKPNGTLLVHTENNKLYLDLAHKWYIYPISSILLLFNKLLTKKSYPGLPKDPRNDFHKTQHVNEPTFFYLRKLFKRYNFEGKIISHIGLIKTDKTWKDYIYNFIVLLYPLSLFPPLIYFFATDYTCVMSNKKKL